MKALLFSIFLISSTGFCKELGLPHEPDTTVIKLRKIPQTKSIILDYNLLLPETQQLNKAAGSFVAVYEKKKGQAWTETQKISLSDLFNIGSGMHFSKPIQLRYSDSQVAIFSTIFHCGKDHKTACYIQGFQGITTRTSAKAEVAAVDFAIEGKMK